LSTKNYVDFVAGIADDGLLGLVELMEQHKFQLDLENKVMNRACRQERLHCKNISTWSTSKIRNCRKNSPGWRNRLKSTSASGTKLWRV